MTHIKERSVFFILSLLFILVLFFSIKIAHATLGQDVCKTNTIFHVGTGIYDITGPAAEEGMMGYAMIEQKTAGIYQRLWARAFVIESPCNGKRIVFVSADLGQIFQGIKQQVVLKLKEKYGDRYEEDNVLLTATHQHSGPGGYSTYALYNLSTLGFNRDNFDTIIRGIVAAIEIAQQNIQKAQIKIAKGQLTGIQFNRSPTAYLKNPKEERDRYQSNTDTEMTLIRFDALDGKPIGMINWFPLHGVSMNNKNHLINGDNKGYAAYLFEKDFQSNYGATDFIAAFAQSNAGDVSPNEYGHEGGSGLEGIRAVEKAGQPQYEKAKQLFENADEVIQGGIDYRHTYVEMNNVKINPQYTDGTLKTTCPAAIGVSMLAGTQDGEGVGKQGVTCDNVRRFVPWFICEAVRTNCQGVKPIVLETGTKQPYSWTPNILPFQVFKIGQLVIAAVPFELTTMTGRRLRNTIEKNLLDSSQDHHIVLSTLSNAYAQYVTTNEEYQLQRYEGASTLFGPWQAAAVQQIFANLTKALAQATPIDPGPTPLDLSDSQATLQTGVLFDDKPAGKLFGDVKEDVSPIYKPGDIVKVSFWGGHPKNNLHIQDTFLEVQQFLHGKWQTIRRDRDWDTEYHWERYWWSYSVITIVWRVPENTPEGQYRILHKGEWKSGWGGAITSYEGHSSVFNVIN